MSRPAKYDADQILDAALAVLSKGGLRQTTVAAIARELGAPSGSLYHRFPSRDVLLATLWLRSVERFQGGFLAALDLPRPRVAAQQASLFVLRWCREEPAQARLLLLYHRDDLLGGRWPREVVARARRVRRDLTQGIGAYAKRLWPQGPNLPLLRFALLAIPYGAVRAYIAQGAPIPEDLDQAVVRAVEAALFGIS